MLAWHFGWEPATINGTVVLEAREYLEEAGELERLDYRMQLAIATNPMLKGTDQKALWTNLGPKGMRRPTRIGFSPDVMKKAAAEMERLRKEREQDGV